MSDSKKNNDTTVANELKVLLSNLFGLYIKIYKFHWNVSGREFLGIHKYFQELYEELIEDIDEVAERIRALGSNAPASLREFLDRSSINESIGVYPDSNSMISELITGYETISGIIQKIYESCDAEKDEGTKALISVHQTDYQKNIWFLSSILK